MIEMPGMKIRRRDTRIWFVALSVFAAVFLFTFLTGYFKKVDSEVGAASLDGFDPGFIISDWQMGNYGSMTEAEIQAWLTSMNACGNRDYDYYLRLSANTAYKWHFADGHFVCLSEELFGDGEVIGEGETAAHIIWQTAQDYRINPQVLLVLLQKETGLITDPIPNDGDYRKATGYGCPDTAPCSSQYYGFKNQVRKAAALFRTVLDGGWTNYPLGENYIQYNPNPDCGGSVVNVRSLATSALYRYTPYQPNEGALAAGRGTAYCGAYGNRNFYLYFEEWFGGIRDEVRPKCEAVADLPTDDMGKEAINWLKGYDNDDIFLNAKCEFNAGNSLTNSSYRVFLEKVSNAYGARINGINYIADNEDLVNREGAVYYLWKMFGEEVPGEETFGDIDGMDLVGKTAIVWAYNNGITKYYSVPGEFAPYNNITRREMAIFLWRFAGEPEVDITGADDIFRDLPEDELGKTAIVWAYNNGITKYYSVPGEFAPYNNITRREMAIFLWRFAGEIVSGEEVFNDLTETKSLEIKTAIVWAYNNGITKYYSVPGEFAPYRIATRREAAIFIKRAAELVED